MGFAVAIALGLCGQIAYSVEDSLNQWENHLLESRWVWVDQADDPRRILLVLKCYPPDERHFELYMYDRWDADHWSTVRAWTGTYKMESRENRDKSISEKLVRLTVDQHWVPVDGTKVIGLRERMLRQDSADGFGPPVFWHWSEELEILHWTEERDFKRFLAELKIDGPSDGEGIPLDYVKFLLRSTDVKHVGWWPTGTEIVFSPLRKWRRSPSPFRYAPY